MVEIQDYIVLTAAQVRELMAEIETQMQWVADEAFAKGCKVGFADAKDGEAMNANDAFDAGYDQGYDDGHHDGYGEGVEQFGDDYDEGYAEGYEDGFFEEVELRAAEKAAFGH